jgi:hypothetical protein
VPRWIPMRLVMRIVYSSNPRTLKSKKSPSRFPNLGVTSGYPINRQKSVFRKFGVAYKTALGLIHYSGFVHV